MKRILMLLDNPFQPDYRVLKEAQSLIKAGYAVKIFAEIDESLPELDSMLGIEIERVFKQGFFSKFYSEFSREFQRLIQIISNEEFDVLHCHDYLTVHFGAYLKQHKLKKFKLIYDAHEYITGYPIWKVLNSRISRLKGYVVWKVQLKREMNALKHLDGFVTVSEGIGLQYVKKHNLRVAPYILRNIPDYKNKAEVNSDYFYDKFNISKSKKIIVHTSSTPYSSDRIRSLVKVIRENGHTAIVFFINNFWKKKFYEIFSFEELKDHVFFHDYVPNDELVDYLSVAHIGLLYTWRPDWLSYWYSLGNRVFELGFAGLPILATSQPEFQRFVHEFKNGEVFDGSDDQELKNALFKILDNYDNYKQNALKVRGSLSWDSEVSKLTNLYQSILVDDPS